MRFPVIRCCLLHKVCVVRNALVHRLPGCTDTSQQIYTWRDTRPSPCRQEDGIIVEIGWKEEAKRACGDGYGFLLPCQAMHFHYEDNVPLVGRALNIGKLTTPRLHAECESHASTDFFRCCLVERNLLPPPARIAFSLCRPRAIIKY